MTWSSPEVGKSFFETDDVPTEGNISTYIFDNLLAIQHPYDYSPSDVDVNTTTSETSLWSKVIAANDLGSNGHMIARLSGDYLFNNAAANTATIRVKFGGSTVMTHTFGAQSTLGGAVRYHWRLIAQVGNKGAANSQEVSSVSWWHNHQFVSSASATGTAQASTILHGSNYTSVDTTSDQTFQVTVQWSASSANNSWRKRLAALYLARN